MSTALNADAGIEEVRRLLPDVVLMDINMPGRDGIKATEILVAEPPHAAVVLMSVQEDREYLRRAMQAGAREFLVKPFSADELVGALRRVHQLELVKRRQQEPDPALGEEGDGGDPDALEQPERRPGAIHLVFSGKGGVGKSMLAINLAATLVRATAGQVALIDFDLQFGDVGVLLGLDSSRNIFQVVEAYPNIDPDFINALMPEAPGGFRVLLCPQSPEYADLVSAEHARAILGILQESYDHIVVDTSSHLGEVTLEAIERSDNILVLVDLSLPAVKEAKLALRVFQRLNIPPARIKVVLNRSDSNSGLSVGQVESSLESRVLVRLPSDGKSMVKSVQRAEPFVKLFPESDISQRLRELVGSLVPLGGSEGRSARAGRRRAFWTRTPGG